MILAALLAVVSGGTAQAGERQLLFYNHAWGTYDRVTADAVEHSAYLRAFADFEVRTTTGAGGEVWTGRYLRGRETYLEIFGVGDVPGQDGLLGSAGLGLSTEHDGDITAVRSRLAASGVPPFEFVQTRDFGDHVPVPWFDAVLGFEQYDRFGAWAMEYRDEYFADPRGQTQPARYPGDVGRERYLPDNYRDRLMRDITFVRLAVTERDFASTVPLLRAGGFKLKADAGGVTASRGGTTMRFDKVRMGQTGLKRIEFALNRGVARHEERIGNSTLVVGPGRHAVWTF
ncbi:DUF5829 family protein [Lentzea chajnantorensis]